MDVEGCYLMFKRPSGTGWGGGGGREGGGGELRLQRLYVVVGGYRGRKLRSGFTKSIMHISMYALYNP